MLKNRNLIFVLKILFHLFLGTFLGCSIVVLYVSSNGTLQQYIVKYLQDDFKKRYNCHLECRLNHIDWLSLRLHFTDIVMKPIDESVTNSWSIVADKFVVFSSWWSLCSTLRFKISGSFEHIIMYEYYKKTPHGLHAFVSKLFQKNPSNYIVYDSLSLCDGFLLLDKENGLKIHVPYSANLSCEKNGVRMVCYAQQGKIAYNENIVIDDISGSFIWDLPEKDIVKSMYLQMNMGLHIVPFTNKGHAYLIGTMKQGFGNFTLKNEDMSFVIDPIQIRADSQKCLFDISIRTGSELCQQLDLYEIYKQMQGSITLDFRGDLYDFLKTVQMDVLIDNVLYKSKKIIHDAKLFVHYDQNGFLGGQLAIDNTQWLDFVIRLEDKGLYFIVTNYKDIVFANSYWKVLARKFEIKINKNENGLWVAHYNVDLQNDKLQENKKITGNCLVQDQKFIIKGSIDDILYELIFVTHPMVTLQKVIFSQNQKKLIDFIADKDDISHLLGTIDFECIKYLVTDQFKSSFAQDGFITFEGYVKDGVYYSQLQTKDANIRVPKVYNVIQNITAACEFDIYNRFVKIKNVKAVLHEGEISCSQATIFFNKNGVPYFMHIPLILDKVLLSWDRGIFMLLSGGLLLQQSEQGSMHLTGQLIVEKSQLKENLFSSEFQEKLFGKVVDYSDKDSIDQLCNLDVAIFTKDLLQVTTSFLSAKARLDLALKGTTKKPELTGLIQLMRGSFYFPYKSLDIADGKLFFLQDQPFDPLLDVTAKGKLKRFGVTMRVSGSIFAPNVQFDASPYLTEEQILSLLLLGIEDSSLSIMVSGLLTQKLTDLVFGSSLSKSKLQSRFDQLSNKLTYWRFVPQFAIQTGRGGLRAIFEIDASDRLHGRIDTNLMQLEDTKFDVDYYVTDDITLRAQKDGPSAYGGEVELRWKFG